MAESERFKINSPHAISETFEDEVILLNFETGSYYSLDKSGALIWGLMEKRATTGEIIEEIISRYEGSLQDIEKAVKGMIAELLDKGLIVPDGSGGAGYAPGPGREPRAAQNPAKPIFEEPAIREYTDMQELLLLDPIHEVDEAGWPFAKADPSAEEE